VTALIFDCDGVLSDTERHGHLPAFNRTFEEFGLPVQWSAEDYGVALGIGGGKERMAALLTPDFITVAGLPADREGQLAEVAKWHRRKTELYVEMVRDGQLPPRPGIARVVTQARAAGWQLAVCSTSAEPSVRAILENAVGQEAASDFLVLAGDVVAAKKPSPDIYLLALDRLRVSPSDCIVVEDSRNGLLAATGAGLTTVVTVNGYTREQDFGEAALVVSSLGDPDGDRTDVYANRTSTAPDGCITLKDLLACFDKP
jgi:HAD superfamily hydrolase (TIGR01509 family)